MKNQINKKHQEALNELYRAKDFFLERFSDEDRVKNANVFITIQSGGRKNNLGHFWADRWDGDTSKEDEDKEIYHEINICAEHLNRPVEAIFETLLHELVHLQNNILGIKDCNEAQYHNKDFKRTAEKFGLTVDKFPGRGWALTSLNEDGISAIAALNPDKKALSFRRIPVEKVKKENQYITITLKKDDWQDFFEEKLEKMKLEKPKELVIRALEKL